MISCEPKLHVPEQISPITKKPLKSHDFRGSSMYGGEIGIRTLGTGEGTTDFESVPFGHSGISPTARIITACLRKAKRRSDFFPCYQMLASITAVRRGVWRLLRRLRSHHRGLGGSGLCPSSSWCPCPTGGSRPG